VFLALAIVILISEHGAHALSIRTAVELVWAVMVLGLIFIVATNLTELRVGPEKLQVRCMPIELYARRTLARSDVVSIHHWAHRHKGIRYRLAVQTAFPVHLGAFETPAEARAAAEAIAGQLQVDCRETPPNRKLDLIYLGALLRIVAWLAAPLILISGPVDKPCHSLSEGFRAGQPDELDEGSLPPARAASGL
jgi:hypothetical protein